MTFFFSHIVQPCVVYFFLFINRYYNSMHIYESFTKLLTAHVYKEVVNKYQFHGHLRNIMFHFQKRLILTLEFYRVLLPLPCYHIAVSAC